MKKLFAIIAALVVAVFAFAGCGGSQSASSGSGSASSGSGQKVLKIGASPVPHAEILEVVKPLLAKEGIELQVVEFSDYVQPNLALNDKELDANFFQHEPYLDNFMTEHTDVKLANAGGIHIEPMGIYSKKIKKLDELKDGASIAIPNDPTNGGRALLLLDHNGLLKLKPGTDPTKATINDIAENPKKLEIIELEAAQLPRSLDDVTISVINAGYAKSANLDSKKALATEDNTSPYVNIIAAREQDKDNPTYQKFVKIFQSDNVRKYINDNFSDGLVPAF